MVFTVDWGTTKIKFASLNARSCDTRTRGCGHRAGMLLDRSYSSRGPAPSREERKGLVNFASPVCIAESAVVKQYNV